MKKDNDLVSFIRGLAKNARETGNELVPLCALDALLGEYDKERNKIVQCRDCKKYTTTDCPLCCFGFGWTCTGGPWEHFYCAFGEEATP